MASFQRAYRGSASLRYDGVNHMRVSLQDINDHYNGWAKRCAIPGIVLDLAGADHRREQGVQW